MTVPVSAAMTLADYAESCDLCAEALKVRLHHRYFQGCMSCVGRDLARNPVPAAARGYARVLKDRLMASDFDAAMAARQLWLTHDEEARHAA